MKKKSSVYLLAAIIFLAGCSGGGDTSSSSSQISSSEASSSSAVESSSSSSSESSSSSSSESIASSSSEEAIIYDAISSVYEGEDDDSFYLKGVVAQFTYGYNGPSNFYLADETGSILIYPNSQSISSLEVGQTVAVRGVKDHYQSSTDATIGSEIGYYGAVEIKASEAITILDESISSIPEGAITTSRIKTLSETDFRNEDLSSRLFRVPATITKATSGDYTNYFFNDLSMDQSLYCYSTISGSDYSYLDSYVDGSYSCVIAVHSMRPRDEAWRIVPISIGEEVSISDEDTANFALDRLEDQFMAKYTSSRTIELLSQDSKLLDEAVVSYQSSSQVNVINTVDGVTSLTIDASTNETFTVTISLAYKEVTYTREVSISVEVAATYETSTIAEILAKEEGETVYVKGIYLKFTANYSGLYLVDETGILPVYYQSLSIEDYVEGEMMTFKGTVKKDFVQDGYYEGHNRLADATLLDNDGIVHSWDTSIVAGDSSVSTLYNNFDTSMVQKIYKVNGYPKLNNSSTYYSNWRFYDSNGSYLTLYCANSGQLSWLNDYSEVTGDYYIYVRDVSSKGYGRFEIVALA